MNLLDLEKFDKYYNELYEKAKLTTNQVAFSKDNETLKIVNEILYLIKESGQRITYKNLTNMNLHLLVKILNYNDFFKKELNKEVSGELKTFSLIY